MSRLVIVPATLAHMRTMSRAMRAGDRAEVERAGADAHRLLHWLWRDSYLRRAALVDGELAAVWGCQGSAIAAEGVMWLFTAQPVERIPLLFFRQARREVAEALTTHARVWSCVLDGYDKALRFFQMIGFSVGDPEPMVVGGAGYRRIMMERV